MNSAKPLVPVAIVVGILFLVVAYLYATHAAQALPAFLPGYKAGDTHPHTKHALAAFVLALGSFVFAWFQSGPKRTV